VKWSRREGTENTCRLPLPLIALKPAPFSIDINCPLEVLVGHTFQLNIEIRNQTESKQQIKIRMADHRGFLLAGLHNALVEIDAGESTKLDYILFPEAAGKLHLPKMSIIAESLDNYCLLDEKYTRTVLVLP
jgi:hypothetical protein